MGMGPLDGGKAGSIVCSPVCGFGLLADRSVCSQTWADSESSGTGPERVVEVNFFTR